MKTVINELRQDLIDCDITWKDIALLGYLVFITASFLSLLFICYMEGIF